MIMFLSYVKKSIKIVYFYFNNLVNEEEFFDTKKTLANDDNKKIKSKLVPYLIYEQHGEEGKLDT